MTERFQNKYRISAARLKTWDYSSNAAYFITLCTQNRENYFGEIQGGKVQLSAIGKIVETEWIKTPAIRPDMKLELSEFVVMPNHFHAILIIGENRYNTIMHGTFDDGELQNVGALGDDTHPATPSPFNPSPTTPYITPSKNKFGPQTKNLASIIRGFKSAVTTHVKKAAADATQNIDTHFAWQPRYHDHVIRDAASFVRIQEYIVNNPACWRKDKFYFRV
jgi:REP element-mobilizing transposase RayT